MAGDQRWRLGLGVLEGRRDAQEPGVVAWEAVRCPVLVNERWRPRPGVLGRKGHLEEVPLPAPVVREPRLPVTVDQGRHQRDGRLGHPRGHLAGAGEAGDGRERHGHWREYRRRDGEQVPPPVPEVLQARLPVLANGRRHQRAGVLGRQGDREEAPPAGAEDTVTALHCPPPPVASPPLEPDLTGQNVYSSYSTVTESDIPVGSTLVRFTNANPTFDAGT